MTLLPSIDVSVTVSAGREGEERVSSGVVRNAHRLTVEEIADAVKVRDDKRKRYAIEGPLLGKIKLHFREQTEDHTYELF